MLSGRRLTSYKVIDLQCCPCYRWIRGQAVFLQALLQKLLAQGGEYKPREFAYLTVAHHVLQMTLFLAKVNS